MQLHLSRLVCLFGLAICISSPIAEADTLLVANKSDDTVDLIDLETGESVATVPTGHAPHEIAVSADGARAVITNYGDRDAPGNSLTVIRTATGAAQRVAVFLDRSDWPEIVGTVSGDDTIFVATRNGQDQKRLLSKLKPLQT